VPDLVVTDVTVASRAREGRRATVTATIANVGIADAGASSTEFVLDGSSPIGTVATPAIPAGGSSTVSVGWDTRGVKGDHTIRATSDSAQVVEELSEGNNVGVRTVNVQGNKIQNGSFEQPSSDGSGPAAWTGSDTGAGRTSWSDDGTDDSRAATITGTGGSVALAGTPTWTSAPIPVQAGEVLDLVASVQTTGTSSAPTVGLAYLGAAGQVLDTVKVLAAPLTTDGFVTLERSVTIPAGVPQVRIVLGGFAPTDARTKGTVVFDDIGLYAA
jgi:hypothetical protein